MPKAMRPRPAPRGGPKTHRRGGLPPPVVGELRHKARTGKADAAIARLERAVALLDRGDARGAAAEAQSALRGRLSSTAAKVIGLHEAAELTEDEAAAAITLRTRQYAAYQRKWMRRIPGLVSVRGDRPSREIALEILDLAGRRQPVSADRAV